MLMKKKIECQHWKMKSNTFQSQIGIIYFIFGLKKSLALVSLKF